MAPLTLEEIQQHLEGLTKPPGSLGRLEEVAASLCRMQQTLRPVARPRRLVVFAADHGVTEAGVSMWPNTVTGLMIRNIVQGGAACSVLARATDTELVLVDVGSLSEPLPETATYRPRLVRRASRNLAVEPALTREEFWAAWQVGAAEADLAAAQGVRVVAGGEMGIGNSTPAACLTVLLTESDPLDCVGHGAGADEASLGRKRRVVQTAVETARRYLTADPVACYAAVAGLEIVALAGFYARAAQLRRVIVVDGFIATAGALLAEALQPGVKAYLLAAHRSAEPGHSLALARLGLTPLLDGWKLRLGEGTGALLVLPLLDSACAVVSQMATLAEWGIAPHD